MLLLEYASLSLYIPELVVPIRIFIDRGLLLRRKLPSKVFLVVKLKLTASKVLEEQS